MDGGASHSMSLTAFSSPCPGRLAPLFALPDALWAALADYHGVLGGAAQQARGVACGLQDPGAQFYHLAWLAKNVS